MSAFDREITLWDEDTDAGVARPASGEQPVSSRDLLPPDGRHQGASAYRNFVLRLADALEMEALRRSKVLQVLDIGLASTCRALAQRARCTATRFASWAQAEPTYAERQSDLYEYFEIVRTAKKLGVAVKLD
jgi:hypothetical protein